MDITLEEAYKEACLALGESVLRERFLTQALEQATAPVSPAE